MTEKSAPLLHIATEQPSAAQRLIKTLSPYKELATILLFFAGGALWIAAYFATKSQVKELRCFARESITLTRAEITLRTTYDDIVVLTSKVADLEQRRKESRLSEAEGVELRKSSRDLEDLKAKRESARRKFDDSEKKLLDGKCAAEGE